MTTEKINDSNSPWISAQNREWETVLNLGVKHICNKGSVIIGGGQPINDLYYLHIGQLKYSTINREGQIKILWYLDNGNIFGAAPFFESSPSKNYNALTCMEKCEIYTFSRECFYNEIVVKHPRLLSNLIRCMANRIYLALDRGGDLDSLLTRVCKIIFHLTQRENIKSNNKIIYSPGISQQELAFILGIHRVTLNSIIMHLKNEGVIEQISKSKLVIGNMEKLVKYVTE